MLKIPVVALLWLVWWAIKEPEPALGPGEDDGGSRAPDGDGDPRRPGPRRRGPHDGLPPPAPERVRKPAVGRPLRAPR